MAITMKEVITRTRQAYQAIDKGVSLTAKQMKATCTKGCAGCCYMLVSTTFVEAMTIADYLIRNRTPEQLVEIRAKLKERSDLFRRSETNRSTIFRDKTPCPFLEVESEFHGTCSVYGSRPLTCRMHYVVSDPKLCMPPHVMDCDIIDVTKPTWAAIQHISGGNEMLASFGPLEPLVLHALDVAEGKTDIGALELAYWRQRILQMFSHDRAIQERLGIEDKYVKEGEDHGETDGGPTS
jgi:Fe-S-cluster containining protein